MRVYASSKPLFLLSHACLIASFYDDESVVCLYMSVVPVVSVSFHAAEGGHGFSDLRNGIRTIFHLLLSRLVLLNQLRFLLIIEGRLLEFGHVVTGASFFKGSHPHMMNFVQNQALVLNTDPLEELVEIWTLAGYGAFRCRLILISLRVRMIRAVEVGIQFVHAAAL